MKIAQKIVGIAWMASCAYFFATLVQGIYFMPLWRVANFFSAKAVGHMTWTFGLSQ